MLPLPPSRHCGASTCPQASEPPKTCSEPAEAMPSGQRHGRQYANGQPRLICVVAATLLLRVLEATTSEDVESPATMRMGSRPRLLIRTPAAGVDLMRPWESMGMTVELGNSTMEHDVYMCIRSFGLERKCILVNAQKAMYPDDVNIAFDNNAMLPDDTRAQYQISLEDENGIILDGPHDVEYSLRYCMAADVERWRRSAVLSRHRLHQQPARALEPRYLWEALPPIPSTLLARGGTLMFSKVRGHVPTSSDVIGLDLWPSLADLIVVEDIDLPACLARGYACIGFGPEDYTDEEGTRDYEGSERWSVSDVERMLSACLVFVLSSSDVSSDI